MRENGWWHAVNRFKLTNSPTYLFSTYFLLLFTHFSFGSPAAADFPLKILRSINNLRVRNHFIVIMISPERFSLARFLRSAAASALFNAAGSFVTWFIYRISCLFFTAAASCPMWNIYIENVNHCAFQLERAPAVNETCFHWDFFSR